MRDPKLPPYRNTPSSTLALRLQLGELSIRDSPQSSSTPNRTRSTLNTLALSATIVLFTPVITPATTTSFKSTPTSSTSPMDPFESLGRALASNHPRIRHVPFVPSIGFTDTHLAFLSQADAIIIVICEPSSNKQDSFAQQVAFAERTHEESRTCSPILVQCGEMEGKREPRDVFPIVLKSGRLDEEVAGMISSKLFEWR